jgi:hypothetical protein
MSFSPSLVALSLMVIEVTATMRRGAEGSEEESSRTDMTMLPKLMSGWARGTTEWAQEEATNRTSKLGWLWTTSPWDLLLRWDIGEIPPLLQTMPPMIMVD